MKVPGTEKPIEKSLAFPVAEFESRLDRVRASIAERNLDALLVTTPENIYYLSGYHTPGYYCSQALVVPKDGVNHVARQPVDGHPRFRSRHSRQRSSPS